MGCPGLAGPSDFGPSNAELGNHDEGTGATSSGEVAVSRPFPRPASGRIAVKVINHYGDEILKVYGV